MSVRVAINGFGRIWYENEWAYAIRVAELIPRVHALGP